MRVACVCIRRSRALGLVKTGRYTNWEEQDIQRVFLDGKFPQSRILED